MRGSTLVSGTPRSLAPLGGAREARRWLVLARRFASSPIALLGLGLFLLLLLMAAAAPLLATTDPIAVSVPDRLQPPSSAHWFGTDDLGRDIYSRVIWGSRLAVRLGVLSVAVAATGGVVLGLVAGYYEGRVDQVISRVLEIVLSFPELLFAIAIVAILGPSLDNLIVALGLFGWPGYARIVRGSVLSARRREYVEAARAVGARASRIMFRHILPNVIAPVIILSATRFGGALLAGSGLSFIGLGVPIPQPEWGAIMASGRDYIGRAWWITLYPGALITLAVLGVNLLGDGLRDILDPRMR
jgi:peptide/nickel transport system permease protein